MRKAGMGLALYSNRSNLLIKRKPRIDDPWFSFHGILFICLVQIPCNLNLFISFSAEKFPFRRISFRIKFAIGSSIVLDRRVTSCADWGSIPVTKFLLLSHSIWSHRSSVCKAMPSDINDLKDLVFTRLWIWRHRYPVRIPVRRLFNAAWISFYYSLPQLHLLIPFDPNLYPSLQLSYTNVGSMWSFFFWSQLLQVICQWPSSKTARGYCKHPYVLFRSHPEWSLIGFLQLSVTGTSSYLISRGARSSGHWEFPWFTISNLELHQSQDISCKLGKSVYRLLRSKE